VSQCFSGWYAHTTEKSNSPTICSDPRPSAGQQHPRIDFQFVSILATEHQLGVAVREPEHFMRR
jgi:hypothetical protein